MFVLQFQATLDCRIGSECFTIISMSYKEMIVNMHVKRPLRIHLCQFKLKNIQINKLTAIIDLRTTDSVSFESHLTKYISD